VLLIDENISFRVAKHLKKIFLGSIHLSEVGLIGKGDLEIWSYAKQNGLTILTYDTDFVDLAQLKGSPPKVVKIKTGNLSNTAIMHLLELKQQALHDFIQSPAHQELDCLII
jgi:predicted nuclease of predicted toxin-antitoxin system